MATVKEAQPFSIVGEVWQSRINHAPLDVDLAVGVAMELSHETMQIAIRSAPFLCRAMSIRLGVSYKSGGQSVGTMISFMLVE